MFELSTRTSGPFCWLLGSCAGFQCAREGIAGCTGRSPKGFRRPFNVVTRRSFLKYRLRVCGRPGLQLELEVLVLVLVESSSTLGSEYYKTGALQQWTLVQSEKEYGIRKHSSHQPLRQHQTGDGGRHNSHSIAHSKHAAPLQPMENQAERLGPGLGVTGSCTPHKLHNANVAVGGAFPRPLHLQFAN